MKIKLFLLLFMILSAVSIKAQNQQLTDENSNTWEFLEATKGYIWNDIYFMAKQNPWDDWGGSYDKIYIYYRQIGSKMLLRMVPSSGDNKLLNVQPNPYYGKTDRYKRDKFEYKVDVSTAVVLYFNL